MGLSDNMLGGGMPLLQAVHGESVSVIGNGPDSGKSFQGIIEIEPDFEFEGQVATDRRAKTVVRFPVGASPNLKKMDKLKTADNRIWAATVRPAASYLTVDFELIEQL